MLKLTGEGVSAKLGRMRPWTLEVSRVGRLGFYQRPAMLHGCEDVGKSSGRSLIRSFSAGFEKKGSCGNMQQRLWLSTFQMEGGSIMLWRDWQTATFKMQGCCLLCAKGSTFQLSLVLKNMLINDIVCMPLDRNNHTQCIVVLFLVVLHVAIKMVTWGQLHHDHTLLEQKQ